MSILTPNLRQAIQDAMRSAFPESESQVARFYAMQQYHLGWRDAELTPAMVDPGKLLRPYLARCSVSRDRSATWRVFQQLTLRWQQTLRSVG